MGERGPLADDALGEHDPPEPPEWLADEALAEWHRVVVALESQGLVQSDGSTLALYCAAWAHWRAIEGELGGQYTTEGARENTVRNPLFVAWKDAAMVVKAYAEQLGLTPKSRLRMPSRKPPPAKSALAAFLDE
jgi:P27 family predicted phage terminase small subunit